MPPKPARIMWLAIAAGYFADVVISLVIAAISTQFGVDLERGITFSSAASVVTGVLLVLSTGLGGWIAGRLAKHEWVLHGVLVGGIGIFDMLAQSFFADPPPLPNILLQCAAVVVGGFGGWLSRWIPAPQEQ